MHIDSLFFKFLLHGYCNKFLNWQNASTQPWLVIIIILNLLHLLNNWRNYLLNLYLFLNFFLFPNCEITHKVSPNTVELVDICALQLGLSDKMIWKYTRIFPCHPLRLLQTLVSVKTQFFSHWVDLCGFLSQHKFKRFFFVPK